MEGKLEPLFAIHHELSKFHPRSGDCIWIQRATHRRNTALFVTRQNLRRCPAFTCPGKGKITKIVASLPKRSRFSHTIDFYFLWIIVTGCGHQLRFTTRGSLYFFQIFNELLSRNNLENCNIRIFIYLFFFEWIKETFHEDWIIIIIVVVDGRLENRILNRKIKNVLDEK